MTSPLRHTSPSVSVAPGWDYRCAGRYRYGFNGKESDDEVSVGDGSYDFGARMYDARLGRWWSVDFLVNDYPQISGYAFAANSAIWYKDPDGNKIFIYYLTNETDAEGEPVIAAYEYGTQLKPPRDKFVRKTIRTLNKIQKRGMDPIGVIESLKSESASHVAIVEKKSWNNSSFILQLGNMIAHSEDGAPLDIADLGELPPDEVHWCPYSGLISPDGRQRSSAASGLLHELAHKYYTIFDPEGKLKEFNELKTEEEKDAYYLKESRESGDFHTYDDRWIIQNVESRIKGEWKRSDHSTGYHLKTKGSPFSLRGNVYGRWGKEDKVKNLKEGKPINR